MKDRFQTMEKIKALLGKTSSTINTGAVPSTALILEEPLVCIDHLASKVTLLLDELVNWAVQIGVKLFNKSSLQIYISFNYFRLHVCLSFHPFLQSYYKMSLMKVAWHVLRVQNM